MLSLLITMLGNHPSLIKRLSECLKTSDFMLRRVSGKRAEARFEQLRITCVSGKEKKFRLFL